MKMLLNSDEKHGESFPKLDHISSNTCFVSLFEYEK